MGGRNGRWQEGEARSACLPVHLSVRPSVCCLSVCAGPSGLSRWLPGWSRGRACKRTALAAFAVTPSTLGEPPLFRGSGTAAPRDRSDGRGGGQAGNPAGESAGRVPRLGTRHHSPAPPGPGLPNSGSGVPGTCRDRRTLQAGCRSPHPGPPHTPSGASGSLPGTPRRAHVPPRQRGPRPQPRARPTHRRPRPAPPRGLGPAAPRSAAALPAAPPLPVTWGQGAGKGGSRRVPAPARRKPEPGPRASSELGAWVSAGPRIAGAGWVIREQQGRGCGRLSCPPPQYSPASSAPYCSPNTTPLGLTLGVTC